MLLLLGATKSMAKDPPFPWALCPFPQQSVYGVWEAFNENNKVQFYLSIDLKTHSDYWDDIIEIDLLNMNFITMTSGLGFIRDDNKSFVAGMSQSINKKKQLNYWLYVKHYCDSQSGKSYSIVQLEPVNGRSAVRTYVLRKVKDYITPIDKIK